MEPLPRLCQESFLKTFCESFYFLLVRSIENGEHAEKTEGIPMQQLRQKRFSTGPTPEDRVRNGLDMWRREVPSLEISGKEVCARLVALNSALMQRLNAALAPYGLKYPEYGVLATLRASGAPYKMSPKQLLETMFFTSGGMSNMLNRLDRKGLISRSSDETDRRVTLVALTEEGIALADETMELQAKLEADFCRGLPAAEQEALAAGLSALLDGQE
ncbi:MarR family transcriptional regulator [Leisingera daeponensis]|uniref:MarR family transcriptional regulator n=1 Tax=Leisingera daeponensis TaxID=405746 RepID=A0ABS7NLY3_9RHOB|nr:MarR family transcriptional regulator [Leisingera daeponensis]MBY6142208.1 MarR family transcriptional regulator [Leisingera daeponensis]